MKFPYRKFLLPQYSKSKYFGHSLLKPIIPIEICFKDKKVQYLALIDSGADFCIFHGEIGTYLGLDVKKGIPMVFSGIQGNSGSKAYLHEVKLTIGGKEYQTIVGFSFDISPRGFGVLGQKGFFDIFTVKFDLIGEEIELKEKVIKKR